MEIVPTSDFGRIVGIVYMFVGIIILGMFIAQIRSSILGKNKLGRHVENNLTKQIKRIEDKQGKLFEILNDLKNKPLKNDEKTNIQSENSNNMDKPNSKLSDEANELLSEYNRLLKEAENAQGIDEEELPKQLEEIRDKFKQITGNDIDSF